MKSIKGHSFGNGNITYNNKARAKIERNSSYIVRCWHCQEWISLKVTKDGEYCERCNAPIHNKNLEFGQMVLADFKDGQTIK